jgi:hypothetical protein
MSSKSKCPGTGYSHAHPVGKGRNTKGGAHRVERV